MQKYSIKNVNWNNWGYLLCFVFCCPPQQGCTSSVLSVNALECEWVWNLPTNHAINGAEEHRALGGRGALAQILQHQWAMAEDIDKLPEVEDPHLLKVLPLLVRGGSTDRGNDGERETQSGEKERLQTRYEIFRGMIDRLSKKKTSRVEISEVLEKVREW